MKTLIKSLTFVILSTIAIQGRAQQTMTICAGSNTVVTAINSLNLSNPSYSLNPGGITSSSPIFTVSPSSSLTYTLYVTGTNSISPVTTTSNMVHVSVFNAPVPISAVSPSFQNITCSMTPVTVTATANPSVNVTQKILSPFGTRVYDTSSTMLYVPACGIYTHVLINNVNGCVSAKLFTVNCSSGFPTFNVSSAQNFTVGCNSTSCAAISIYNGNTDPAGGPVSYTVLSPSSSLIAPSGALSSQSVYTVCSQGIYTVVTRDNTTFCETRIPLSVSQNTIAPNISVTVPQQTLDCNTPSVQLQGNSSNANVSYLWNFPTVPGSLLSNTISVNANPAVTTVSLIANYTLTITDTNNACNSTSVIPIYHNLYKPNAVISNGGTSTLTCITNSVVLTNQSTTTIPPSTGFPANLPVVSSWAGPAPQQPLANATTYTALTNGVYTMTAKDMNNGCTETATISINIKPTAAFVHTITGGQVVFNDASTNTSPNTTYFWNFGDGNTSTLQNPTHTYINGGAHFVKLKTANPGTFCVDSVIQSINVSGVPCSANSNFSMVPTNTAQVWNVVPSYPWNVTAASWNWGDGSFSNTLYASHQYSAAGMYNICLSVTVSCVASSSTCTSYSVYRSSQEAMILEVNVVAPELISGLTSIETDGALSWDVAPNPNNGEFKLNLNTPKPESMRVVISDLTGQVVYDQFFKSDSSVSVQTSDLPPGMYLVTLTTDNRKSTKRMVISH